MGSARPRTFTEVVAAADDLTAMETTRSQSTFEQDLARLDLDLVRRRGHDLEKPARDS
jgi:hypothetical protein